MQYFFFVLNSAMCLFAPRPSSLLITTTQKSRQREIPASRARCPTRPPIRLSTRVPSTRPKLVNPRIYTRVSGRSQIPLVPPTPPQYYSLVDRRGGGTPRADAVFASLCIKVKNPLPLSYSIYSLFFFYLLFVFVLLPSAGGDFFFCLSSAKTATRPTLVNPRSCPRVSERSQIPLAPPTPPLLYLPFVVGGVGLRERTRCETSTECQQ